jgi:hypothetical protein
VRHRARFWRGAQIGRSGGQALAISADNGRIAMLDADGTVTILARGGLLERRIQVSGARAIALRRDLLAALTTRGRLEIFRTGDGRRLHSWKMARGAGAVDLQYRIALITAGADVFAVNVATGRTARLFHAPGRVAAQLESPGASVQYNAGGHGYLRFIPLSAIETLTQ